MIILQGGRCTGKTSLLIREAHATGAGILYGRQEMAEIAKSEAKRLGYEDVNIFSYQEILNGKHLVNKKINKLYIDELPIFLYDLLKMNVEIATGDISVIAFK